LKNIAIFASGGGSNALQIIKHFQKSSDIKIALIVCNKPDAGVLKIAAEYKIPSILLQRKSFYETEDLISVLKENAIDFIVLAGFLWLVPAYLVKSFPNKIVNIHPALLPKYGGKGMYGHHVHEAVHAAKETETGITIHYVNEKYDEGKYIFQAKCLIEPEDSPEDIARNVLKIEHLYFARIIEKEIKDTFSSLKQSSDKVTKSHKASTSFSDRQPINQPINQSPNQPIIQLINQPINKVTNQQLMQQIIEAAWEDRSLLKDPKTLATIREVVAQLNDGKLRVANPPSTPNDEWTVNDWVKKAVIMYFPTQEMVKMKSGTFEYYDKIPLKKDFAKQGARVVPGGIVRYGAFLEKGVIMMPSFVNIGAYVGSGTMVDTWATVGSCAQIGKNVHLAGGVGIGGVLEPPQAAPTIIEDDCFIGSRCIVVEGVHIEREVVLGANVVLTRSTHIIDVTGPDPRTYKGRVPARSVVIPGTYAKHFPAGEFQVACALIIGKRTENTDKKVSLNQALRDFHVDV
jgi:2,3,4,5-tetrahydropyridine-2,6-dicarboxylate N-succinyltransferase